MYTVKIKRPSGLFWKTLKNVTGDSIIETGTGVALPVRVFFFSDESRLEVPMTYLIRFSPERAASIRKSISKETGGTGG
jgi:hypothetical protein